MEEMQVRRNDNSKCHIKAMEMKKESKIIIKEETETD